MINYKNIVSSRLSILSKHICNIKYEKKVFENVEISLSHNIAKIVLNRPKALNSLNLQMIRNLT
jgi:hypothetical protein